MRIDRKPSPDLLIQLGISAVAAAAAVAVGIDIGFRLDDPPPIIRTEWVNVPPACLDAIQAAKDERARTATERQQETLAAEPASERFDAELTRNDDTIADAAKALDTANRLAQAASMDAAEAAAAFNSAADDCTAEADQ